jgi:hypothetical protein
MRHEQLRHFRKLQSSIYLPERQLESDELIKKQEELERFVERMMQEEVDKLLGPVRHDKKQKWTCRLSGKQITDFRTMQGNAFLVMGTQDWDAFREALMGVEQMVDFFIESEMIASVGPMLTIIGGIVPGLTDGQQN